MKLVFAALIFTLGIAAHAQTPSAPFDFFIDIDNTLVEQPVPPGTPANRIIHLAADGQDYAIREGAPELLASLKEKPGARITVFSAGALERNQELVIKLKLPNGSSASEGARVLSKADLLAASERQSLYEPFNGDKNDAFKKDLSRFATDLDRAILIDDHTSYAAGGQERNLVWVGRAPKPGESKTGPGAIPLAKIRAMLDFAWEKSKTTGKPVPDVLYELQWKPSSNLGVMSYREETLKLPELQRGARAPAAATTTKPALESLARELLDCMQ